MHIMSIEGPRQGPCRTPEILYIRKSNFFVILLSVWYISVASSSIPILYCSSLPQKNSLMIYGVKHIFEDHKGNVSAFSTFLIKILHTSAYS